MRFPDLRIFRPRIAGTVTLVIDDGPSDLTPHLLDMLERGGHRAVLFVLGCNVVGREAMLVDAIRRGFALGNHSFDHPHFSQIDLAEARTQIERTEALIEPLYAAAGVARPGRWFRFPYLDGGRRQSAGLQRLLAELGFAGLPCAGNGVDARLDWPTTVATRDWAMPSLRDFARSIRAARPGDVIEFHDKLATVDRFTPTLVEQLATRSLRATVPGAGHA